MKNWLRRSNMVYVTEEGMCSLNKYRFQLST